MRFGWNASAYQILNPGLSLWFSAAGDAVAGYVPFGDRWIVAGAPVCSEARIDAVSRELDAAAPRTIYFGAGERLARTLEADRAHHVVRIGAQPVRNAGAWTAI